MFYIWAQRAWFKALSCALIITLAFAAAFLAIAAEPTQKNSSESGEVTGSLGMRTWQDSTGKFSIRAAFQDLTKGQVALLKSDGGVLSIPLNRLCPADIAYVNLHGNPDYLLLSAFGIDSYTALSKFITTHNKTQDIVDMMQAFIDCPLFPSEDRQQVKDQLPKWKAIAEEKRILFGKKWILATEHERILKDEERLLKEAWTLIENGQDKSATERLEQASKVHPLAGRADFTLGLMHALVYRHAPTAESHFKEAVRRLGGFNQIGVNNRAANLAAALNNLALTEVRQANHRDAIKHWREAARLNSTSPELVQNIGRYVALAEAQKLKAFPPGTKDDLANLYASLTVSGEAASYDRRSGWLYMRLTAEPTPSSEGQAPGSERPTPDEPSSSEKSRRIVGSGSGFVVHPGYVLTNRHVVEGADGLKILDTKSQQTFTAQRVAISKETDLALLRCENLTADAVFLASEVPRRGTEVMVLGFPDYARFGSTLKTTRGTVSALPAKETQEMCMFDAGANPGNSGGPVCDAQGRVVAILTMTTTREFHNYTFGVPATTAITFIQENLTNYSPSTSEELSKLEWPEVDELVAPSTVLILIEKNLVDVGLNERRTEDGSSKQSDKDAAAQAYEDPWCMACNGHGRVECPIRGCARGTVKSFRTERIGENTVTGEGIFQRTPIRVQCDTCDGQGYVECRYCNNGRE